MGPPRSDIGCCYTTNENLLLTAVQTMCRYWGRIFEETRRPYSHYLCVFPKCRQKKYRVRRVCLSVRMEQHGSHCTAGGGGGLFYQRYSVWVMKLRPITECRGAEIRGAILTISIRLNDVHKAALSLPPHRKHNVSLLNAV
jgi:hypothetical protein